jgi:hypothetical protein
MPRPAICELPASRNEGTDEARKGAVVWAASGLDVLCSVRWSSFLPHSYFSIVASFVVSLLVRSHGVSYRYKLRLFIQVDARRAVDDEHLLELWTLLPLALDPTLCRCRSARESLSVHLSPVSPTARLRSLARAGPPPWLDRGSGGGSWRSGVPCAKAMSGRSPVFGPVTSSTV